MQHIAKDKAIKACHNKKQRWKAENEINPPINIKPPGLFGRSNIKHRGFIFGDINYLDTGHLFGR